MTMLLVSVFFLFLGNVQFMGIFLHLLMFMYMLYSYSMFGVEYIKGDLWGVMGSDYITFYVVLLLMWVMSLVMILFSSNLLFFFVMLLLLSMLFMFFSMNFLYLFIYFEFSMIPMFLMILFMGNNKERNLAGMYMFIYTAVSSLPMLMLLLSFEPVYEGYSINYNMYNLLCIDPFIQVIIILLFLVKVPMVLLHIWLPKAHVEAPVFGSMILASIMLKMGGYGVIRCMDFMELDTCVIDLLFCLCLCGSLMISHSCLYQVDLKVLVAYSSIIHMSVMLIGFFSGSELGYLGGVIMMLSHGICSSGMFYLVNEIYKISGSRVLMLNKGIMSISPILIWLWFIMLINNLGVPPCFGILGELLLMVGALRYSIYVFIYFFFIIFFVSCFVMNMYMFMMKGKFFSMTVGSSLCSYYGAIMHIIPLNLFIFFMNACM